MNYCIREIDNRNQIEACNMFSIDNYMWNSTQSPKAYGWMGYLKDQGLFVKMVCEESNPIRTYKKPQDPVYKDSAMEIFLAFLEDGESLTNDCMYTNFEINSNGAMLANFGKGRKDREPITDEEYKDTKVTATVEDDRWYLEVLFPEYYLEKICDFSKIKKGKPFFCNFYKISENKTNEHYGSFSLIKSDKPNFHMPIYFAQAYIG